MDNDFFLTENEVAKITGLALTTLRNWRSKKQGPPYCKVSRAVRYPLKDLHKYMEKHKISPEDRV